MSLRARRATGSSSESVWNPKSQHTPKPPQPPHWAPHTPCPSAWPSRQSDRTSNGRKKPAWARQPAPSPRVHPLATDASKGWQAHLLVVSGLVAVPVGVEVAGSVPLLAPAFLLRAHCGSIVCVQGHQTLLHERQLDDGVVQSARCARCPPGDRLRKGVRRPHQLLPLLGVGPLAAPARTMVAPSGAMQPKRSVSSSRITASGWSAFGGRAVCHKALRSRPKVCVMSSSPSF